MMKSKMQIVPILVAGVILGGMAFLHYQRFARARDDLAQFVAEEERFVAISEPFNDALASAADASSTELPALIKRMQDGINDIEREKFTTCVSDRATAFLSGAKKSYHLVIDVTTTDAQSDSTKADFVRSKAIRTACKERLDAELEQASKWSSFF